jgi:uncharacterized protein YcbK (DUF882 family)
LAGFAAVRYNRLMHRVSAPRTPDVSRRTFLRGVVSMTALVAVAPRVVLASAEERRFLSFLHTHTGERLAVTYFEHGAYVPEGLATLKAFLKDHRTGEAHEMDAPLFDILNDLRLSTGTGAPFQVISGYRSPHTNTMLREQGHGVAGGSLHMQGRAIDIRLADVNVAQLRDAALALQRGGVGYYRSSNFVHVDTGRIRRW